MAEGSVYEQLWHCAGIIGPKKEFFVSKSLEEFSPEWRINPLKGGFRPVALLSTDASRWIGI
jgi:hypothetical protein